MASQGLIRGHLVADERLDPTYRVVFRDSELGTETPVLIVPLTPDGIDLGIRALAEEKERVQPQEVRDA